MINAILYLFNDNDHFIGFQTSFLKHEVGTLRDTNDQLRATLDMKTETERNLNVTHEELKREISQRDIDTRKYMNKCEELQFKVWLSIIIL